MTFQNIQVDPECLPRASELTMQAMDPAYIREVRTQQMITWGIVLGVSVIPWIAVVRPEGLRTALMLLPMLALLLASLVTPLVIRRARVQAFALREKDLAFQSGLFWRKTVLLPFDRIQHVELSNGPLQRRFGLASLKFYTAGGTSVDLQMDGLRQDQALGIRRFIMGLDDERDDG